MDRGAWWATVHGVTKSLTRLSNFTSLHFAYKLSKQGDNIHQGCILSPCLFNLYEEHMMQNAGLDEAQAGIKISKRNINNLRYADDTYGRK